MVDSTGRQRVLVVDDDGGMRRSLCRLLAPHYETCAAASCEAAIQVFEAATVRVDLVLLDLQFPKGAMQGTEAVTVIRARWPKVRVVVLSCHHDANLALQFGALGVSAYVDKLGGLSEQLVPTVARALADEGAGTTRLELPSIRPFEETQRASFVSALQLSAGNMSAAARSLGVSYQAYRDALIAWGIVRPRTRVP